MNYDIYDDEEYPDDQPYHLQELQDDLPIVTPDRCYLKGYNGQDIMVELSDTQFCTGSEGHTPKTICDGDSGSPVTLQVNNTFYNSGANLEDMCWSFMCLFCIIKNKRHPQR